jgi:metal-responsive CopG/Arc/MetJ family transcriptional regulator
LVILSIVKTAVSLPDQLYADAEKTAQSLGIPRSQLFARALEEFIEHHKRADVTERLNRVYARLNQDETLEVAEASLDSLRKLTKHDSW